MKIEKKTSPPFFQQILDGEKTFEVRLDDFECKLGNILVLKEVDNNGKYTGRIIEKKIKYVLKTKDLKFFSEEDVNKYGFQVMGFE